MVNYWIEIKRFLKENMAVILLGTVIIAGLFLLAMNFLNPSELGDGEDTDETGEREELVDDESEPMEPRQSRFQLLIETVDDDSYTNASLLEYYLNLNDIQQEVETELDIDIDEINERLEEAESDEEELSALSVSSDSESGILTVTTTAGGGYTSVQMARVYYDLVVEEDAVPFLNDKTVYPILEPTLIAVESETGEEADGEEANEENGTEETESSNGSVRDLLTDAVIGIVIGSVVMTGLVFLKAIFSKKLNYMFTYEVAENEKHFLYDKRLDNADRLSKFVSLPYKNRKLILSEQDLSEEVRALLANGQDTSFSSSTDSLLVEGRSMTEVNSENDYEEAVIMVQPNVTTRKWYNLQKELLDLTKLPVKIVQLNRDKN